MPVRDRQARPRAQCRVAGHRCTLIPVHRLVVTARIQGEGPEQVTVFGHDAPIEVGDLRSKLPGAVETASIAADGPARHRDDMMPLCQKCERR
jgi:hypothetical protein